MNAPGHAALTLPVVWAGTYWLLRHALPAAGPVLGVPADLVPPPERAAEWAALGGLLAAAGSVLPDIDYPGHGFRGPQGQVARGRPALAASTPLTWPLAVVLYRAWGHRGLTHAPLLPLLGLLLAGAFALAGAARGDDRALGLGLAGAFLAVGYLAHILEDALTPMGCPLLWPLRPYTRRYRLRPLAGAVAVLALAARAGATVFVGAGALLRRASRLLGIAYRRWRPAGRPGGITT